MKVFIFLSISFFSICNLSALPIHCKQYDVVIYGGSSAGFIAAIQVAKLGKTVALLEPSKHIGGMNVEGLGGTDIDNHAEFQNSIVVGGLALEFYKRIAKHYNKLDTLNETIRLRLKHPELWRFEPHVAAGVIKEWLSETKVDVFVNTRLAEDKDAVARVDSRIHQIRTTENIYFEATVFIDATIEGDLMAAAGISYIVGRESNLQYNERYNGVREHTTHAQFSVSVDPYNVPDSAESGVLATIQNEEIGEPGSADHRIQAYCFRVCLTKDSSNRIPFERPANYNRSQYEIYLRYLKAGGRLYTPWPGIPNNKTDLGAWHDLSHNLYGMNHEYPDGSYAKRAAILKYHKDFTKGLFYFFANDPEVGQLAPEFQSKWAAWGLPKDEFQDNGGWPRMFYVRDARRMKSDYVITEHHIRKDNPIPVEDPIAIAYWPPDVHSVRRIIKDGRAYNEGFVFGGRWWSPFGISYRAIIPKRQECTNLLIPSCPSSSHIAYGAIRIEFTFMSLGQAAALAAVLAIERHKAVQDISYPDLSKKLAAVQQITHLSN